ncbi:MAG: hypothetical protein QM817_38000 [Archangium sp.]
MRLRAAIVSAVFVAGCQCNPLGVDTSRFACGTDDDCISGYECRDVGAGRECVRVGSSTGGGGGSSDSGTGGGGATGGGGGGGGVVDAGLAEKLGFANAPQIVTLATCSAPLTVEALDSSDAAVPVNVDTQLTISFDAGADAGVVAFFTAANCTGSPTNVLTLGAGTSSTSFFAQVEGAGVVDVTVSSTSLGSTSQPLTVVTPPNSLVFTSSVPNPVRGGTCVPMTAEARADGVASAVAMNTTVALSVLPGGTVTFFSDSSCTQAITSTTIAARASLTTFFMKVLSAGMNTVSATAPFGMANVNVNVTAMVRRGFCDFGTSQPLSDGGTQAATFVSCTLNPGVGNIGSTILITQATSTINAGENGAGLVRCRLASNTSLQCSRRHDADPAQLHWQLAEIPNGLRTQRFSTNGTCGPTFTLNPAVDPSKSFVLKSAIEPSTTFDDEEIPVVQLESSTLVSVAPATCNSLEVQVVEWDGIDVERRFFDGGMDDGGLTRTVMLPGAGNGTRALLTQSGSLQDSMRPVCSSLVRGAMPAPNQVELTRGAGDAGCPATALDFLYLERINFNSKARSDEYTVTFAPGQLTKPVSIAPVDMSRTLVISSSQTAGGQGSGETDDPTQPNDGEGAARFVLQNATTVQVTRAQANSTAVFTFYVVELNP